MKILRVINSMNPVNGGPCQGIRNTVPQIASLGHRSDVVCLDNPDDAWIGKDAFKVVAVGKASGSWAYHQALLPWLIKHLSEYDAVIIHGIWQYHSYAVVKATKAIKKTGKQVPKVYVMPHGMLDPYFQNAPGRKLKAIRNSIFWHLIESKVINSADGILFTCQEELELAAQTFNNYHPKAVYNIGYGILPPPLKDSIDNDAFYRVCPDAQHQSFMLFLSRIHEKKGVDLLLKAFDKFSHSSNTPLLVVAGPGIDTDYGKMLQSIVAQSEFLKSNVRFVGMLQGEVKWSAFYNCEAFILPSHQENFGIAVVEAMACAKPILISNKVNIWQEIKNSHAGFVENDTEKGTEDLLNKWHTINSEERNSIGNNALMAFQKYFTVEQAAHNLINTINTTKKHA